MSNNIENDRSNSTGKMYPIDLAVAPQKITIVKSMSNTEVKMAHLITGQPKTSGPGQLITHTGPVGLMRTATQIITPGVSSQPQMIVSGPPIIQGTPIISQGSQLIGQTSQIITQSQLINSSGQIISPGTQIISQGSQLSAQVSNSNNSVSNNIAPSVASSVSGTQVLNVGGQLVSGSGSLVVSSSVRTLPPSVRVLPPLPLHNNRPVLSTVNVSTASGVLVSKGVTSHVPRGLAAGASLAVRPVTPLASSQSVSNQGGGAWSSSGRGRSALVYGGRSTLPRSATPRAPTPSPNPASPTPAPASTPTSQPNQSPHSTIISLPTNTVLTSSGVISNNVRGPSPRTPTPTPISTAAPPRPLPLLQRNYQPTKVVGVASVGVRGVVGNSAPSQLYYEVPRGTQHSITQHQVPLQNQHQIQHQTQLQVQHPIQHQTQLQALSRPLTPYNHTQPSVQVSVVNTVPSINENRQIPTSLTSSAILPRPSILRKREIDGSPSKLSNIVTSGGGSGNISSVSIYRETNAAPGWEDVPSGVPGPGSGSTTMSASSSPPHDEPDPPRAVPDLSPRKKPRKQMLSNEVRQCEFTAEEAPPTPPPTVNPLPKRPQLSSSYVCGWRGTALHFVRPADVRRREPRARDILAIASQRHVLASADGWKVHHLTAQMEDLVSLEADVGEQLAGVLRAIENASGRALTAIQPHSHTLLELIKGNIQRSKIVCEGIQEAREDILRVFKHRNFVSDILTRQADKRCFRKHRSQS